MDFIKWIQFNDHWLAWIGIASAVMFIASLLLIPIIIARLPADYFISSHDHWLRNHPAFFPVFILQQALGILLCLAGVLMLVLPGQGILCILIGLSFISFPGKHRLLRRLFSFRRIHQPMNWIRRKTGVAPFSMPTSSHYFR